MRCQHLESLGPVLVLSEDAVDVQTSVPTKKTLASGVTSSASASDFSGNVDLFQAEPVVFLLRLSTKALWALLDTQGVYAVDRQDASQKAIGACQGYEAGQGVSSVQMQALDLAGAIARRWLAVQGDLVAHDEQAGQDELGVQDGPSATLEPVGQNELVE